MREKEQPPAPLPEKPQVFSMTSPAAAAASAAAVDSVAITINNPIERADLSVAAAASDPADETPADGAAAESPPPPPAYRDIPGTVPAYTGSSRGPPPSYEDTVDPNAEPPSYDSLFGRIRDTHKASRNVADFFVKLVVMLLGTLGCTLACSITIIIPIFMITLGVMHLRDCPAEPSIPIFLIVGGAFSSLKYVINIGTAARSRTTDPNSADNNRSRGTPVQYGINSFLCAWFITGCVWVYRIYPPVMEEVSPDDPRYSRYCEPFLYQFTFWLITSAYIFVGLFTSCICCFSVVIIVLRGSFAGNSEPPVVE